MSASALKALTLANEVRITRAAAYRDLTAGRTTVADLLSHRHEPHLRNATIGELLRRQHRWGDHRVVRLLRELVIPERRLLGKLTDRQATRIEAAVAANRRRAL